MITREAVLQATRAELLRLLCEGHPIDAATLDDTEYKGISLGLPAFIERLSWKTFTKTFHRDPATGHLRGWNVRMEQTGIDGPRVPMKKKGEIFTFGHYGVVDARGRKMPAPCDQGLLIDYGLGHNAATDAMRFMRDPLVSLDPGKSDRLLGWSYVEIGPLRLGTPSFFLLERAGRLSHHARPARG